ncbi:CPBP family intramembrane glutamic endopeptidase [Psychroserpens luteolus]|uniref:CPBP family intramembrane glutamic endopeptidase n=1 Tax=Psychroserpens luteolus TaxID=2855840 RepID=UPI001E583CC1|nr:CPBP family intramembrane glutamic endopeptidase [Psychroserpens luteolus]MCD2260977.1 CPBP family intramembrane metalloprotease [Psychroserpens luteolus]
MLGLLVIIVISWVLLHFIEKKNLNVLGIIPNKNRTIQFTIGLVMISLICLLMIYIETQIKSITWKQQVVNYKSMGNAFIYHLRSALTEDLVFRGALLYILISRIGSKWAILISAFVFGVYHVFSYGMTNDRIVPIIYVVLVTGFTGYVWAYGFHKTKSIMLGLGLHIGYNFIMTCFYPSQPFGELLFTELSKIDLSEWNQFYYSLFRGFFPSIMTLIGFKLLFKSNLFINHIKEENAK